MKTQPLQKLFVILLSFPLLASAQGTFIFDQQSSDESAGGVGINAIQEAQPTGQSFTPLLNGIDFVRFHLFDLNRNNGTGAVVYVNLRADSITGTILGSTAPVALPDNYGSLSTGFADFFFGSTMPLQSEVKYYLEAVVQTGDRWGLIGDSFGYDRGELYAFGTVSPSSDYWFREGIIVPEPSALSLVFFAAGICVLWKRLRAS